MTISISGPYAYGYLTAERGVHRLVRLSPFDEAHRRHTSFVLVEVMPEISRRHRDRDQPGRPQRSTCSRRREPGDSTCKRTPRRYASHTCPPGIVVSCQNERSQVQNREVALKILRGKLYDLEQQKLAEEQARLKGEHMSAGWGNQIRSYVLHPYHMVKDLRTGYETGNTSAVLDGDIQAFIEAYLQSMVGT